MTRNSVTRDQKSLVSIQTDEYARPDVCGTSYSDHNEDHIVSYQHHGARVWVRERLRGTHRAHCLCFAHCVHFKPGQPDNCALAQELYEFDVRNEMTTPVWECPKYQASDNA